MQTKLNRNAYFRVRYEVNIEKERARNREKYHRYKKLYSDLTEEEVARKKEKNRIYYENWRIRQGKEVKERKLKTEYMVPKKIKLPERITHKYVSEVLRKFPKSKLCNILISSWTLAELKEFQLLEEEFNKNK